MRYTRLGASGLEVSRVTLGMMSYGSPDWQPWVLPGSEARRFVQHALDRGINTFDTADAYSLGASEEALGRALQDLGIRHEVVVATKVGLPMSGRPNHGGLSKKHMLASLDDSLRRLRTDYIDLYQLHRHDPATPLDETLEAMEIGVRAGKILHIGASNFSTAQIAPAIFQHFWRNVPRLASMQLQYNLVYREEERDMLPLCRAQNVGVMIYSPLARGLLAGGDASRRACMTATESKRVETDLKARQLYGSHDNTAVIGALTRLAQERGVPPARIAMAWLHAKSGVNTVLCGALELKHIDEAVAAADLTLTDDEMEGLERPYLPQAVKDDAFQAVLASSSLPHTRHSSKDA